MVKLRTLLLLVSCSSNIYAVHAILDLLVQSPIHHLYLLLLILRPMSTCHVLPARSKLYFLFLGSTQYLETSIVVEKETKSKATRVAKKKKPSSKFLSIGKDDTVSILHGVGRVLNPKG